MSHDLLNQSIYESDFLETLEWPILIEKLQSKAHFHYTRNSFLQVLRKRDINQISISGRPATRGSQTTQQVIVRFSNWSARMRANKFNNMNRQKTKVRVQADLTRHRFQLLKSTQSYISQKMSSTGGRDRSDNRKCFAFANVESDLILRLGDGGFRTFKDEDEAKKLVDRFFDM